MIRRGGAPIGAAAGEKSEENEPKAPSTPSPPHIGHPISRHYDRRRVSSSGCAGRQRRLRNSSRCGSVLILTLVWIGRMLQTISNVTLLVQLSGGKNMIHLLHQAGPQRQQQEDSNNNNNNTNNNNNNNNNNNIRDQREQSRMRMMISSRPPPPVTAVNHQVDGDDDEDRPLFVLHVGIPKTGTVRRQHLPVAWLVVFFFPTHHGRVVVVVVVVVVLLDFFAVFHLQSLLQRKQPQQP
jgi:hypothetical protein